MNSKKVDLEAPTNKKSLLIYPFETKNDDTQTKTLTAALANQVSITLKRYNELFIHDSSSADYFLSKQITKAELKDNYGVEFKLKSFLQSSENKFRINLDLTNLKSDKVIWLQTFDFVDHDIFEIQDQISTAVSSEVIPGVLSLNIASEGI